MNTIDLGLNIDQTADIPVTHYWTPEVIKFGHYRDHDVSLVIVFENNPHREVFKQAFKTGKKINVTGSKGKNPCLCLSLEDFTIIVDLQNDDGDNKTPFNYNDFVIYFEDVDGEHVGVIKIKPKKTRS